MNSLPSRTKALIGVSFREFARYALPSIIGMLIVGLQTIIDGLFVGRGVGALGLAAVNIAMPLISSMLSVSIMIISGGIGIGLYLLVLFSNTALRTPSATATKSFHTAIERPLESVVIALCRSIVFVLISMFLLTPIIGQKGIWLSMPIAEVMTLMVSIPLVLVSLKRLTRNS